MRSVVQEYVEAVHAAIVEERGGTLADYIPELAAVDPDAFGICVCTADGYLYEAGDTRTSFTLQSMSKPLTYGLAIEDRGTDAVDAKVGVEPSGDAFNQISLEPETGRPRNPMINAGAIAAASLVRGVDDDERFARVLDLYSRCAGRPLSVDEAVYGSELRTGHRNRAIGWMLRTVGILEEDPEPAIGRYFRQCAVQVDARDLAQIAATLARSGVHPVTGERVLEGATVERVLSVMTTCGMYDGAGDWVSSVGMPAKSGVGGGIIAVLPGQLGIAVYSPRLDAHGNSVRGVAACRQLSREMELHVMHVSRGARSAVRAAFDVRDRRSRHRRTEEERAVLDDVGGRARVYELHGDLLFAGAETVVRAITDEASELDAVVLDVRRVDDVAGVARRMLVGLRDRLASARVECAIVDPDDRFATDAWPVRFRTRDGALEWGEERLLALHGTPMCGLEQVAVWEHPLVSRCDAQGAERLETYLQRRTYGPGEFVVRRGDPPVGLVLVLRGRLAVSVTDRDGTPHPITTLAPGMSLGEAYLVDGGPMASDVRAAGTLEIALLTPEAFARMATDDADLRGQLMEAMVSAAHASLVRTAAALAEHG